MRRLLAAALALALLLITLGGGGALVGTRALAAGDAPPSSASLPGSAKSVGDQDDGKLPPEAQHVGAWKRLLDELQERGFYHGAMAAARRMLVVLPELEAQEAAYSTLIKLAEAGYPGSIRALFLNATLEPPDDSELSQSYYFYKALVNQDRHINRWADYYFKKTDPARSGIYQFYLALQAYGDKDDEKAKDLLSKLLDNVTPPIPLPFGAIAPTVPAERPAPNLYLAKQAARTLARILFEEKNYDRSLEIYRTFLLRLPNPTASDWLETAWDLFYLKRYPEALGFLYDMESQAAGDSIEPEKYILRGLIYHSLCDRRLVDALLHGFENDYNRVLQGIRNGETLSKFPVLYRVHTAKLQAFDDLVSAYVGLRRESMRVHDLNRSVTGIASYLYRTEIELYDAKLKTAESDGLDEAAQALLLTHEGIRFLGFEIAKSRFDPERVFEPDTKPHEHLLQKDGSDAYRVIWQQPGDYWRDERTHYTAEVTSQCAY